MYSCKSMTIFYQESLDWIILFKRKRYKADLLMANHQQKQEFVWVFAVSFVGAAAFISLWGWSKLEVSPSQDQITDLNCKVQKVKGLMLYRAEHPRDLPWMAGSLEKSNNFSKITIKLFIFSWWSFRVGTTLQHPGLFVSSWETFWAQHGPLTSYLGKNPSNSVQKQASLYIYR